jgi:hypothetical protein
MTIYTCNLCYKIFKLKTDYIRHINRKFPCNKDIIPTTINDYVNIRQNPVNPAKCVNSPVNIRQNPVNEGEINVQSNLICNFCGKQFKRSDYCKDHITLNRCKAKLKMDEVNQQKDELLRLLLNKTEMLLKQMDELTKAANNDVTINNNSNSNNSNSNNSNSNNSNNSNSNSNNSNNSNNKTVNIGTINNVTNVVYTFDQINEFVIGRRMSKNEKIEILKSDNIYANMVEKVYCNDKHPEFQTAYIENKKMTYAMILKDDNQFHLCHSNYVINKILKIIPNLFNIIVEEARRHIDGSKIKQHKMTMNEIENSIKSREEKYNKKKCIRFLNSPDDISHKYDSRAIQISNDTILIIKSALYNNRSKIRSTHYGSNTNLLDDSEASDDESMNDIDENDDEDNIKVYGELELIRQPGVNENFTYTTSIEEITRQLEECERAQKENNSVHL